MEGFHTLSELTDRIPDLEKETKEKETIEKEDQFSDTGEICKDSNKHRQHLMTQTARPISQRATRTLEHIAIKSCGTDCF
jgi:hypothetical protein